MGSREKRWWRVDDAVKRYQKRRKKRLEERFDKLDWITLKNGVHVPVKDGKAVGGPVKGDFYVIDKYIPANGKKNGERRGQVEAKGGRVPDKDLTAFNKKALDSIMDETGYSQKEAKKLHQTLMGYFGGDYREFTEGKKKDQEKIIDDGLARMGTYDGEIYRGMSFTDWNGKGDVDRFADLEDGDEVEMKSVSSWSSDKTAARDFAEVDRPSMSSVMLVCKNNKSAVGVQHLSRFRDYEAEVLAPSTSKWRVVGKKVYSKFDLANELVKEYSEKKDLTDRERSMMNMINQQLKINKAAFKNSKYVMLEVEEV